MKYRILLPVVLLAWLAVLSHAQRMKMPRISDDLSEVVDDDEDEEWKAWGRHKEKDEPEPLSDQFEIGKPIDVEKLQQQKAKGPQLAFARLVPDDSRTMEDAEELGSKWASLLRTGGMSDQIYPIDKDTILISITNGKYMDEVKEFCFLQPECDEFEWNSQRYHRPGDNRPSTPPPPPKKESKKKKKSKKGKKKKSDAEL